MDWYISLKKRCDSILTSLSYSFDYYISIIFLESVSSDYYILALLHP